MSEANFSSPAGLPRAAGVAAMLGSTLALFAPWQVRAWSFVGLLGLLVLLRPWRASGFGRVVAIAVLAAMMSLAVAWDQLAQRWPAALDGERVIAELQLDSLAETHNGVLEFDAEARVHAPQSLARTLRVRVRWSEPPRPWPRAGERWEVMLRLEAPRPVTNPGAPDEARQWLRDRVQASGTVLNAYSPRRVALARPGLLAARDVIAARVRDIVTDPDAAALIAGLAVGATGAITPEQWQVFSVTGTTHLVAISGLHVTLFAWCAALLARRGWRRLGRFTQRVDREPFAAGVGMLAAAGYAALAGFGIPTQRTVLMLAVWWGCQLTGRVQQGFEVWGLALLAVLLLDPLAPLDAGFWLSFAAMAMLIAAGQWQRPWRGPQGWRGRCLAMLRTQWQVSLILVPLTLAWFGSVSILGVLANVVAIPVFSFVLVPLVLAGLVALPLSYTVSIACWQGAEWLYIQGWPMLQALAELPLAHWSIEPEPGLIIMLALLLPWWVFPVPLRWRVVSLLALLPWSLSVNTLPTGEVVVTVLDAGDGAAVIARTRAHTLVVDTGEVWGSEGRRGATLVAPALRALGRRHIDRLVLSASHGDRARGAASLAEVLPVRSVIAGGEWSAAPTGVTACATVQRWRWDEVSFETHPAGEGRDASCIVRIAVRDGPSMWLLERADRRSARELEHILTPTTLVLVPRRGSAAAIDPRWVQRLAAREVVVSAGEFSSAREQRVVGTWRIVRERVRATARDGALSWHLRTGSPPRLVRHLDRRLPRLWDAVPRGTALGYDAVYAGEAAGG